jgi:FkbM family methyltransferase
MGLIGAAGVWLERGARMAAHTAIALLPAAARRRIADYRFGYTGAGRRFAMDVREAEDGLIAQIDGRLRLRITKPFCDDLRFHFVDNAQSRNEMAAFIDATAQLPPDALLFDVGAHRGLFSLVYCALGPARRAVLLEPSASLARDARELLALNGFDSRAEVRTAGVGERAERRRVREDHLGFARPAEDGAGLETDFVSLDDEWQRVGEPPAIVKIDVEGAEGDVLRGASRLLAEARPIVLLELHMDVLRASGQPVDGLLAAFTRNGYRFFDLTGQARSAASIARSLRAIVRLVARADRAAQ